MPFLYLFNDKNMPIKYLSNKTNSNKNKRYKNKVKGSSSQPKDNKRKRDSRQDLETRSNKKTRVGFQVNESRKEDFSSLNINKTASNTTTKEISKETNTVVIDLSDEEDTENCQTEQVSNPNPMILNLERISLFQNDLKCLEGKEWLKDNVVDLALSDLRKEYQETGQAYLFNSLFFSKLRTLKNSREEKKDYYTCTKRWFKNDTLSNKRFWVIPICDKNHWYVIVVARPRSPKPIVFVLDSLRKKNYESVLLIKTFLQQKYAAEHKGKCKKIAVQILPIPQQQNATDCGLFAIRSANLFLTKKGQEFYELVIKNHGENSDKISEIYKEFPVPSRQAILKKIQRLIKTH